MRSAISSYKVRGILERHEELFESRTAEEAVALGRSPLATVWNLREGKEASS